jgi:hypothetical protein
MCDLPAFYPQFLIDEIEKRISSGKSIHTIVLWTKHANALLTAPLFPYLSGLKNRGIQLFVQLTITGMGGKCCGSLPDGEKWFPEPNVPHADSTIALLPSIVNLTGHASRISIRIDPLIWVTDCLGNAFTNSISFETIVKSCAINSISQFVYSFLEPHIYRKVDRRFAALGIQIHSPTAVERNSWRIFTKGLEETYQVHIEACCVEGIASSACVNGRFIQSIHPANKAVSLKEPHTRPLCGCTTSVDIGGWPPKICWSGCDYCYARPAYKKG